MKEHSMRMNMNSRHIEKVKEIREINFIRIQSSLKKVPEMKEGPRMIFLRAFALNGSIEEAKQALINNGFKLDSFENPKKGKTADDTFKQWIEEFHNKDNIMIEERINKGR